MIDENKVRSNFVYGLTPDEWTQDEWKSFVKDNWILEYLDIDEYSSYIGALELSPFVSDEVAVDLMEQLEEQREEQKRETGESF